MTSESQVIVYSPDVNLTERKSALNNSIQEVVTVGDLRGYKVYTATLTQTGTDPATIIVLENTIDPGIYFEALGNGNFNIFSPLNAFTLNKTIAFSVMFGDDNDSPLLSYTIFADPTGNLGFLYVRKITFDYVNIIGDNLNNIRCPIEIRVYN